MSEEERESDHKIKHLPRPCGVEIEGFGFRVSGLDSDGKPPFGQEGLRATCGERESSLLTTYWSESTLSS